MIIAEPFVFGHQSFDIKLLENNLNCKNLYEYREFIKLDTTDV